MKRIFGILLMICTFNIVVIAQERGNTGYPRFTFGAEWSYVATISSGYHHNFFSPEGYRVNLEDHKFGYTTNGDAYVHAGYNFNELWNLSLYIGFAGVDRYENIMPVSVRGTRYFGSNPLSDRNFVFLDLGSGLTLKMPLQEILVGKVGYGYRISLSRDTKLDFHIAARMTYTHTNIIYDNTLIPIERTNRNNIYTGAVSIGMAVVF